MTTLCLTCGGHEISVHVASSGNCNTALPWQKEATHKITQIWEKVFSLTRLGIFYLHSKFGAQEHSSCWKIFRSRDNENALMTMRMPDTFCSFTANIHFLELLPFVIVRQNSRLMISYGLLIAAAVPREGAGLLLKSLETVLNKKGLCVCVCVCLCVCVFVCVLLKLRLERIFPAVP